MKFLPENHRVGKIVKNNTTTYLAWDCEKQSINNGMLRSQGIEVVVVDPSTKYLYDYDYPSYYKFLNTQRFIHMHGVCPGSIVTEQFPLFHINQTYPYWIKMFSSNGFDKYIMMLVGVSLFDYRIKYNMPICLDESQSKTVQNLSKLYGMSEIAPEPINVKLNDEDDRHDYEHWGIEFKYNDLELIKDSYCYLGECLSRYEINNAIKNKKDMPRFWNQRDLKPLDLSDIIYDNQLELF